jgi:hypothetical protein
MRIDYIVAAIQELHELPAHEQSAMANVFEKLRLYGDRLAYPHSSRSKAPRFVSYDQEPVDPRGEHSISVSAIAWLLPLSHRRQNIIPEDFGEESPMQLTVLLSTERKHDAHRDHRP